MGNKYVLAMYDIRAKQDFIFRSNHLQEIVGGSCLIRDCFDNWLYPQAEKYGKGIFHDEAVPFSRESFEKHIEDGFVGEIVYNGGGNFLLLYKDMETFRNVTYDFTKKVYEKVGTLRILATGKEGVDFDNYKGDSKELYALHATNESTECFPLPYGTLPVVQTDNGTSQPLSEMRYIGDKEQKVSKESAEKYRAFDAERKRIGSRMGAKFLDDLVTKKGEESLLAILYIDGNSMGAKVASQNENCTSYEDCVANLRKFSEQIQKDYVDNRLAEIDEYLHDGETLDRRLVLGAGDEINLILNARDALSVAEIYLNGLKKNASRPDSSSCVGISVFHSHAPYADAYRIAEECCETGKRLMKKNGVSDACIIDFHYCQGAIGTSLEEIRKQEEDSGGSCPWILDVASDEKSKLVGHTSMEDVMNMKKFLNRLGHSNVKGLMAAAKDGPAKLELELRRIRAHMSKEKREEMQEEFEYVLGETGAEAKRKLIFDMVSVYDIWFKEG